jgi:anaerobic ribonucleoside-triphosphate reductase activating protein
MVKVYKIIEKTNVEGPNTRFCIWVQGCKKHCKGCYAKDTWDFKQGQEISTANLLKKILSIKSEIEGVTFLGGEPFEQATELSQLAKSIKSEGLSIVCFTGYTLEELKAKNDLSINKLLTQIDLLIDGGFEEEKYDLSRAWVGSSNQRYIFLTDFYSPEVIKKYQNKIEVRIQKDGKLEINGMGDFNELNKSFCLQLGKNKLK